MAYEEDTCRRAGPGADGELGAATAAALPLARFAQATLGSCARCAFRLSGASTPWGFTAPLAELLEVTGLHDRPAPPPLPPPSGASHEPGKGGGQGPGRGVGAPALVSATPPCAVCLGALACLEQPGDLGGPGSRGPGGGLEAELAASRAAAA